MHRLFRFTVASALLATAAVAVFFGYGAHRARSIAQFNRRLIAFVDQCHASGSCDLVVQNSESSGLEWIVGGPRRKEVRLVAFTSRTDPTRCLGELSRLGVQQIGMVDYSNYAEEVRDARGIELLPKFSIHSLTINCRMTPVEIRLVTGLEDLGVLCIHQDYEADWLTDDLVSHMESNPTVFDIDLFSDILTEKSLSYLDRFPNLLHVKISSSQIAWSKVEEYQAGIFERLEALYESGAR